MSESLPHAANAKRTLASMPDVLGLLQMAGGWILTGIVPVSVLPATARGLAALALALHPSVRRRGERHMLHVLGPEWSDRVKDLYGEYYKRHYEQLMGRILDTHARGWHPEIDLTGEGHLREALGRGRGAVLWSMSFCGHVVLKAALHRAGFAVTHLSTPYHGGFSTSRLAMKVLNPWTLRSENKYLAGRVLIPLDGSLQYLQRLKECLRGNGCVSISGEHRGGQNVAVRVLNGDRQFATGAVSLASSTGAALLTLSAARTGPFRYRVRIDPPIETDPSSGRREGRRAAVEEFGRRLGERILANVPDWEGWSQWAQASEVIRRAKSP